MGPQVVLISARVVMSVGFFPSFLLKGNTELQWYRAREKPGAFWDETWEQILEHSDLLMTAAQPETAVCSSIYLMSVFVEHLPLWRGTSQGLFSAFCKLMSILL